MNTRDRLLLAVVALGMVALAIETRYEHRHELNEYWQMWIPIVGGGIGALAATVAAFGAPKLRGLMAGVLGLTMGIGLAGVWLHTEGEPQKLLRLVSPAMLTVRADDGEEHERGGEHEESGRPLGAPLSFTGLGLIGMIAAWPTKRNR